MRESKIEKFLVSEVKKRQGLALKLNSISMAGLPDRLILLPNGIIFFVELKSEGKKARPLQENVHRILKKLSFEVYVIDSIEMVREVIKAYG